MGLCAERLFRGDSSVDGPRSTASGWPASPSSSPSSPHFIAVTDLPLALATALAVEAALLHNFVWHQQVTWRDRTRAESP